MNCHEMIEGLIEVLKMDGLLSTAARDAVAESITMALEKKVAIDRRDPAKVTVKAVITRLPRGQAVEKTAPGMILEVQGSTCWDGKYLVPQGLSVEDGLAIAANWPVRGIYEDAHHVSWATGDVIELRPTGSYSMVKA